MTNDKLNLLHELLIELANDINAKYGDDNNCAGQVLYLESSLDNSFGHPGLDKFFTDFWKSHEIAEGLAFEAWFNYPDDMKKVWPNCKDFSEVCLADICNKMNNLYDQPTYFVEAGKVVKK